MLHYGADQLQLLFCGARELLDHLPGTLCVEMCQCLSKLCFVALRFRQDQKYFDIAPSLRLTGSVYAVQWANYPICSAMFRVMYPSSSSEQIQTQLIQCPVFISVGACALDV